MPSFPVSSLIPPFTWHWTTILHYLMLLGALSALALAGDESSLVLTPVLAIFALLVGADLYLPLLSIQRVFIFLIRVAIFGLPIVIAGLAPTEQSRATGVGLAVLSVPLLALTVLTCYIGSDPVIDPRILSWCALA